jgi:hypothetical protein
LESHFEAPSPPHEEVPTTSSKPKVHLDVVIVGIERLNLDENSSPSQLYEQPRPSSKSPPKWLINTLESQSSRTSTNQMVHLTSTKRVSWKNDLCNKKELIMRRLSPALPPTKWATIHTLFSLAAHNGWKVHQMYGKTAFLNGGLKEDVFMS